MNSSNQISFSNLVDADYILFWESKQARLIQQIIYYPWSCFYSNIELKFSSLNGQLVANNFAIYLNCEDNPESKFHNKLYV